jgi:hypothetical protein
MHQTLLRFANGLIHPDLGTSLALGHLNEVTALQNSVEKTAVSNAIQDKDTMQNAGSYKAVEVS